MNAQPLQAFGGVHTVPNTLVSFIPLKELFLVADRCSKARPRSRAAGPVAPGRPRGGGGHRGCLSRFFLCLSYRRCLYHNRDLRVEGVGHHRSQLSAALRPQVLEAKALPSQLLQAHVLADRGAAQHLGVPAMGQGGRRVRSLRGAAGWDQVPPICGGGEDTCPFCSFSVSTISLCGEPLGFLWKRACVRGVLGVHVQAHCLLCAPPAFRASLCPHGLEALSTQ